MSDLEEAVGGLLEAIVGLIFFGILFGIYTLFLPKRRTRTQDIVLANGRRYTYTFGNNISYGSRQGHFNGAEIHITKQLPHIYLDGLQREGLKGPGGFFTVSQHVELEGNFNDHFRLYVAKGYEVLALSILSPDVMWELMQALAAFDVEIVGDKIRIITRNKVHNNSDSAQRLQAAVMQLMQSIDHRLTSWTNENSHQASQSTLTVEPTQTINFAGAKLRLSSLLVGSFMGIIGIMLWAVIIHSVVVYDASVQSLLPAIGAAALLFPILTVLAFRYVSHPTFMKWIGRLFRMHS